VRTDWLPSVSLSAPLIPPWAWLWARAALGDGCLRTQRATASAEARKVPASESSATRAPARATIAPAVTKPSTWAVWYVAIVTAVPSG
jgi:hypothetical protein